LVVISEVLRFQQRIQQVDHQSGTYDQHDDRFSIHDDLSSANSIAELHIANRQHEEHYGYDDKDQVLHASSFSIQTPKVPPFFTTCLEHGSDILARVARFGPPSPVPTRTRAGKPRTMRTTSGAEKASRPVEGARAVLSLIKQAHP
jgi:hypothetical protein